jgi:predicted aldo/keto reductase-like oxidoreductase
VRKKRDASGRREFLKKSAVGLAGATILPAFFDNEPRAHAEPRKQAARPAGEKFIARTLGNTGITVPVVSMGVMNADNPNLVRAALEKGITLLDTAHYYQRGRNEEMVGSVIKDVPRDSYYLATKARASTVDRATRGENESEEPETVDSFIQKVELSLKRLSVDHVDILYLHSAKSAEDVMTDHVLTAMQRLKKDGKIRFIGVSTHGNEHEVIRAATESKIHDVVLTAYNFRMQNLVKVEEAIAGAAGAGLGIVAMKTQAGVYWDRERTNRINMKAALKWALQNEHVGTAIPGFTAFDQLDLDLTVATDIAMTPEEKEDLKLGIDMGFNGLYCQQCEHCVPQCPHGLEIPALMRSYMYAYGYRNPGLAKETLASIDTARIRCSSCSECAAKCVQGFDIKDRVMDIARLRDVPAEFLG